jgi:uncharacterized protein (TIGR03067 family)
MKVNRRLSGLVVVAVNLACFFSAAGAESLPKDGDLGRLQGRWAARAGARREIRVTLDIQGRQVEADIATPQGLRIRVRGELKLDETASPRNLDWIKFAGADQQELPAIPAIYKIDRDTFTVCNGGLNGSRPREFKAGDGVLADVVVFRRVAAGGE